MNRVILTGRFTKDIELKKSTSGTSVVSFTLAVDRRFAKQSDERKADFINCVGWRVTAEFITKYFTKGDMVCILGNLQNRSYEDKNGVKRYISEVICEEVYFCGSKKAGGGDVPLPTEPPLPTMDINVFNQFAEIDGDEDKLPF